MDTFPAVIIMSLIEKVVNSGIANTNGVIAATQILKKSANDLMQVDECIEVAQ